MPLIRRYGPAVIWAIVILILMGTPGNYFPEVVSFWEWLSPDKVVHLIVFGIQAALLLYGMQIQYLKRDLRYRDIVIAFVLTVLFGLLTEVLQWAVFVGRDGNIYDFLADSLGALMGILLYLRLKKKKSDSDIRRT